MQDSYVIESWIPAFAGMTKEVSLNMGDFISIYCTYPNEAEAARISRILVEARLVACANIMPQGASLYWWDGKVQAENEVYVLYKTTRDQFDTVEAAIKSHHPYKVPCIVAWDITQGHGPYLNWIETETSKS